MATMQVPDDIRKALDEGRITWAEAGELRDLRRDYGKIKRRIVKLEEQLKTEAEAIEPLDKRLAELEDKVAVDAPTDTI